MLRMDLKELFGTKGKIGPHDTQIADLMLSGQKPVCELIHNTERDRQELKTLSKAVEKGQLKTMMGTVYEENAQKFPSQLFCQLDKLSEMQELADLFSKAASGQIPYDETFHRKVGEILGYSQKDINYFIDQQLG